MAQSQAQAQMAVSQSLYSTGHAGHQLTHSHPGSVLTSVHATSPVGHISYETQAQTGQLSSIYQFGSGSSSPLITTAPAGSAMFDSSSSGSSIAGFQPGATFAIKQHSGYGCPTSIASSSAGLGLHLQSGALSPNSALAASAPGTCSTAGQWSAAAAAGLVAEYAAQGVPVVHPLVIPKQEPAYVSSPSSHSASVDPYAAVHLAEYNQSTSKVKVRNLLSIMYALNIYCIKNFTVHFMSYSIYYMFG